MLDYNVEFSVADWNLSSAGGGGGGGLPKHPNPPSIRAWANHSTNVLA